MPHTELRAAPLDPAFLPPQIPVPALGALPPSTNQADRHDRHPPPEPSQGPCSQTGSFSQSSMHVPTRGVHENWNQTLRHRGLLVAGL